MRLFLAISPEPGARAALAERALRVRNAALPGVRTVAPEKLHLTLQFLGGTAEERVEALTAACRDAAAQVAPFDVELRGAGAFPSTQRAKVIWLGVVRGEAELRSLEAALTRATAASGFVREARAFHPHATLAYVKQPLNVTSLVSMLDAMPGAITFRAREVLLVRSHTEQGGARYEVLATFPLAASAT